MNKKGIFTGSRGENSEVTNEVKKGPVSLISFDDVPVPSVDEEVEELPHLKKNNMVPLVSMDLVGFDGKDPDKAKYMLLLRITVDDEDDSYDWLVMTGRQATYDYIKELIQNVAVDIDKSFIMSETSTLESAYTIYRFMRAMIDDEMVIENTSFNPDDYRFGDDDEIVSLVDSLEEHGVSFKYNN